MKNLLKITSLILGMILLIFIVPVQASPANTTGTPAPVLLWSGSTGSAESMSDNAAKVSCSGDGKYIAVGYGAGIVEFRDRQGAILWRWQPPHSYYTVWEVVVSRNGEYTGVVLYDPLQNNMGELDYFDKAGNFLWNKSMKGAFGFESLSGDGNVVALSDANRINFFNTTGQIIGTTVLEGFPWAMALSDDGSTAGISTGYDSGYLYAVSANGTILWRSPEGPQGLSVAISGDGRYLASTDSNTLRYFTIGEDKLFSFNSTPEFTGVAVSSDSAYVATSSQYYLRFFNSSGAKLWQYEVPTLPTKPGPYLDHLTMSEDGNYLSVTTNSNRTLFFNREGKLLFQNESPTWIVSTSLSQNGKYLAIGTEKEFVYFDTGIDTPVVEPEPTIVATTVSLLPTPSSTPRASAPTIMVIAGICAGILLFKMKQKKDFFKKSIRKKT